MDELGHVAMHIYHEGVSSVTTRSAQRFVIESVPLRRALARGDVAATRRAIRALIGTGHMVRIRVSMGGHAVADVGSRLALAKVSGVFRAGRSGATVRYELSVEDSEALVGATQSLTSGALLLRSRRHALRSWLPGVPARLPARGVVRVHGERDLVFSFAARTFDGAPVRVSLVRPVRETASLCGRSAAQTRAIAAGYVGLHIYNQEARGYVARHQVQRAATSRDLVRAIASGNVQSARAAVVSLLNQHVVRLRVMRGSQLLADVGGPYVLAPLVGSVNLPGGATGRLVLSVQDDLGYLLLAHRLIGVEVLIREGSHQVMGTLHPGPASVPDLGPVRWKGRSYEAFSFIAAKFPSGRLRISLLVPV